MKPHGANHPNLVSRAKDDKLKKFLRRFASVPANHCLSDGSFYFHRKPLTVDEDALQRSDAEDAVTA